MLFTLEDEPDRQYARVLAAYLADPTEAPLEVAYEYGRSALKAGIGTLEVVAAHKAAVADAIRSRGAGAGREEVAAIVARASDFLTECLAPYEIAQRSYREANAGLRRLASELEQRAQQLKAANDIIRRAEERAGYLADASRQLGGSLDLEATLRVAARLALPALADGCVIELGGEASEHDTEHDVVAAWRGPAGVTVLDPRHHRDEGATSEACLLRPQVRDARTPRELPAAVHDAVRAVDPAAFDRTAARTTFAALPLVARGREVGVLALVFAERRPTEVDHHLGEEFAYRAALALDNARLYREAREAVRVRDDFLSLAFHELKTPLTPLGLHLETGERRLRRGEAVGPEFAQTALRHVREITALVTQLLDASMMQAGGLVLELRPVDLVELCRESVGGMAGLSSHHRLELTLPPDELLVDGDRLRLRQAISHLLDNAVKFSPQGGEIRVSLALEGNRAHLAISDRGIGVPAEQRQYLFERFFRAGNVPVRSRGGLGLGLYVSREIIHRHGGRIWAVSESGHGSTFHVELPVRREAPGRPGEPGVS